MALLLLEGFEDLASTDSRLTMVTALGAPYGAGFTGNAYTANGYSSGIGTVSYPLGTDAHAHVAVGAHVKLLASTATSGNYLLFFKEGATNHVQVGFDATGHVRVVGGNGTVLATSAIAHTLTSFFHLEVEIVVSDTVGSIIVRIDGTTEINLTNVDTRNAATGVVDTILFSGVLNDNPWGFTIDNLWITNGVSVAGGGQDTGSMGQMKIENIYPTGVGGSSAWVNSAGTSVNNWSYVDDMSMADYVDGSASGNLDLYALGDGTPALGAVIATQVQVLAQKSATGTVPGDLKIQQKSVGGTTTEDILCLAANLTTGALQYHGLSKFTDPNGDAWSDARFAGLQAGPKVA